MISADELRGARDHAWQALGATPIRRAMLGRGRCDAIARVAFEECNAVAFCSGDVSGVVKERVLARYQERDGLAFMSLLIAWAISAIVQAVVIHWLNTRESAQ